MTDSGGFSPFRNILGGLARAPLRFPVTLGCAVAWAGVTVARQHGLGDLTWKEVEVWQVLFMSGLFLSLAAALFAEGRGWGKIPALGLSLATLGLAAAAAFLQSGPEGWDGPAFYLLVPGAVLLMIVAPFLRRGADDQAVWDFNLLSWLSVLFGGIVAVGLALGVTALLGGLEELFGLNIRSDYYEDAWIVCMSVIWPWQTLAGIPGACDEPADKAPPRWTRYIASWLLIPLALIYLALLYAFAAKTLATWELPRGTVGWLVGGFAGFGLAVWSAAWPFRETGNRLVRSYIRWFHFALVVPVVLLAVGIGVRVAEYGITEKRYALILLTLWLAGIAIYGILARPARLAVAPAAFAALLIAGAVGPWGAASVSTQSQLGRLESLLAKAGILVDGRIDPEEGLASPKEARTISSIVSYLSGGRREVLVDWMADAGATIYVDDDNETILGAMGLDYIDEWRDSGYFSYSVSTPATIDVSGFDVVHKMNFGDDEDGEIGPEGGPRYLVERVANKIVISLVGQPEARIEFDLGALAEALLPQNITYNDDASTAAMTLDATAGGMHARLLIEHFNGRRDAFDGYEIDYGNALLLLGSSGDG